MPKQATEPRITSSRSRGDRRLGAGVAAAAMWSGTGESGLRSHGPGVWDQSQSTRVRCGRLEDGEADDTIGGCGHFQPELGAGPAEEAQLAARADGLNPAEVLLDQEATALTPGIAGSSASYDGGSRRAVPAGSGQHAASVPARVDPPLDRACRRRGRRRARSCPAGADCRPGRRSRRCR